MDFHDVYERHAPSVLRFASGLTGDPALAQDLTSVHLEDRLTFLMFRDMPWSRALWAVAAVLWFAYARLHRGARAAGL